MLIDDIQRIIRQTPGLTASEIARAVFGVDGYHQRVSNTCRLLADVGRVERRGTGGPANPYTYYDIGEQSGVANGKVRGRAAHPNS